MSSKTNKNITIIGTGYVGLVAAVGLADFGNSVTGCDIDGEKIDKLNRGIPTIYEPGIEEYLKRNVENGRLSFTTDVPAAVRAAEVMFLAVGTPQGGDGSADLSQIEEAAKTVGADNHTVAKSMGMDGRISPKFLHPGPGYGGSCFPKDTRAVVSTGERYGVDMSVIRETVRANEEQKVRMVDKLTRLLGGSLEGKTVAVLGLAFKSETDDVRESPAITIVDRLLKEGV